MRCGLRFGLLGAPVLYDGHAPNSLAREGIQPIPVLAPVQPIGSVKVRTLLAALLLEPGRVVPVEALKDALWGGAPPASAQASLHNHVARLRRLLDDPARLRAVPPGYLLRVGPGELDVHVFQAHVERARAAHANQDWRRVLDECASALALWRGAPLTGLPPETFGYAFTQRLTEARLLLLDWRYDAELHVGGPRLPSLIPELTALTAEHPLRESYHRQLMLALHRTGRRAESLAVHRDLRNRLLDELGVEPGPAIRAAHMEVLRLPGDPGDARPPAATADATGPSGPAGPVGGPARSGGHRGLTAHGVPGGVVMPTALAITTDLKLPYVPAQPTSGSPPRQALAPSPALAPTPRRGSPPSRTSAPPQPLSQTAPPTPTPPSTPTPSPTSVSAPPPVPRPAQLPPPPAHFTGRTAVADDLRRTLAPQGRPGSEGAAGAPVVVVHGMPGVGKSALALHVAHALRERFPDGQLYVDLHGGTADVPPLAPAQALTALLRDLGADPRRVPEHPDGAAALLRSLLAPTRTLLVLDDAEGAAQLRPLLPAGPGCAVIVTSRSPLTALDGARRFPLASLTGAESAELLRAVSGRGGLDAGHPLVELTGRLPLALCAVAARLAARRALTPDLLAAQLAAGESRLPHLEYDDLSVRRSLAGAHEALRVSARETDRDAALVLRRIGALDLPAYDAPLLARLTATDEHRAGAALDRLVDVSLVEETVYGRYAPHDLVRDFARELAAADTASGDRSGSTTSGSDTTTAGQG
ncbi:BTAD domain-containing putative transcriptional regulator [Streptomyces sp. WI04-05B]|uniref:BTAD domain-containing putative transcriptional regulator n=1 Tax=Streptomyces TaxID=1883 RepID=UPI0029B5055B|nr:MULTISPECIES: BTAD domain-containing putative transcriptional regulator [unclassified Streptomyces]MDX2544722.1 BTAD domain-containing putative transcriptional regulator [Streptomyces sp. WI04-05B]MDX2588752.1 BTAD domain-containing putative transcriptional regulator [Streptomyces sp. WI04-05A]